MLTSCFGEVILDEKIKDYLGRGYDCVERFSVAENVHIRKGRLEIKDPLLRTGGRPKVDPECPTDDSFIDEAAKPRLTFDTASTDYP